MGGVDICWIIPLSGLETELISRKGSSAEYYSFPRSPHSQPKINHSSEIGENSFPQRDKEISHIFLSSLFSFRRNGSQQLI